MKTRTDAHDDVALRDEETITWWAMMHNMDDDRVPCSASGCERQARWRHVCPECGKVRAWHERSAHMGSAPLTRCGGAAGCGAIFETDYWNTLWLPM